jgi:hypothetical protein
MCPPGLLAAAAPWLTGLTIATGIAGTVAGFVGQSQQAHAQASYQAQMVQARNAQMSANNQAALEAFNNQQRQTLLGQTEQDTANSQKTNQKQTEMLQAEARARTSAGEAGVSGVSVDALLNDFYRQEAVFRDSVRQNSEFGNLRTQSDLAAYRQTAQARMANLQPYIPTRVHGPSALGAGLQIATDTISGVDKWQTRFNPKYGQ